MLNEGDKAPDFKLKDFEDNEISLNEFSGKKIVYFYPRDDTPGCTIEAVDFSDKINDFNNLGVVVIGISKDGAKSHEKFTSKYDLKILLLSDEDSSVQKEYGVWRMKKFMGKESMGTVRSTFLLDKEVKILKIWDTVSAKGHVVEVLDFVKTINPGSKNLK